MKKWYAYPIILSGLVAIAAASAVAAPSLNPVFALLERSPSIRFVLSETAEGQAIARKLLSHGIEGNRDSQRFFSELQKPKHAELARELAPKFERLASLAEPLSLRAAATRELTRDSGFAAARNEFINAAPTSRLKVAAVQYPVEGARSLEQMLGKMEGYARQARADGAGLIVFPELFVLDRINHALPISEAQQLATIAREETPRIFERAIELSRELDVAIMAGTFPRELDGGIVNTALLAFPDGRIVMQNKLNLTPDEVAWGWKAGNELQVFDAPWGRSTILICYDSQFPSLSAKLAESAPELILVPSMTGPKGFKRVRWAAQARAVEQHAYVVVTGTVDAPGRALPEFTAQAAFLSPQDSGFRGTLRQGPRNQGAVVYSELNLDKLRSSREKAGLFSARDEGRRSTPVRVTRP